MIARFWLGRTKTEDAEEYVVYVKETGITGQRATPGNRASMLLTRELGDETEFMVFSLWESPEAVRAFAGERPEVAVYYPEDERFLLELAPEVEHYEVRAAELDRGWAARAPEGGNSGGRRRAGAPARAGSERFRRQR